MKTARKKLWIHGLQTYLMMRVAFYCMLFQLAAWFMLSTVVRLESALKANAPELFLGNGLLIVTVLGLAFSAMFVWDALKLTHRVVGPLVRIRKILEQIKEGQEVELIRLRKGDLLQEVVDSLNATVKSLAERGMVTLKSTELAPEKPESIYQWAPAFCVALLLAIAATYAWSLPFSQ